MVRVLFCVYRRIVIVMSFIGFAVRAVLKLINLKSFTASSLYKHTHGLYAHPANNDPVGIELSHPHPAAPHRAHTKSHGCLCASVCVRDCLTIAAIQIRSVSLRYYVSQCCIPCASAFKRAWRMRQRDPLGVPHRTHDRHIIIIM